MKILHLTKKYPHAMGGDAVVVSNLVKQLQLNHHQVTILTSNCEEIVNGEDIYKFGLKETPFELDNITVKRLFSLIMLFFKAFKLLHKERPDIIHTHSIDMAYFVSFAARFYKISVVHTFHIVTFYDNNHSAFKRNVELFFARRAGIKMFTAPNAYDVKKLREVGLNTVELPNGVDLDFWERTSKSKKNNEFTFVSVGRLEEQKGLEYLIKATDLLRRKISIKFKVVIVGAGSLEQFLKEMAKTLGVKEYVEFVGGKSPDETRKILESSHVAVFPALYETTPLTLLEAWAMQLPVISTRVGILRGSKLNNTFIPANAKTEDSIARTMQDLLSDSGQMKRLSVNASNTVQAYDWQKIGQRAISIYEKVLE